MRQGHRFVMAFVFPGSYIPTAVDPNLKLSIREHNNARASYLYIERKRVFFGILLVIRSIICLENIPNVKIHSTTRAHTTDRMRDTFLIRRIFHTPQTWHTIHNVRTVSSPEKKKKKKEEKKSIF